MITFETLDNTKINRIISKIKSNYSAKNQKNTVVCSFTDGELSIKVTYVSSDPVMQIKDRRDRFIYLRNTRLSDLATQAEYLNKSLANLGDTKTYIQESTSFVSITYFPTEDKLVINGSIHLDSAFATQAFQDLNLLKNLVKKLKTENVPTNIKIDPTNKYIVYSGKMYSVYEEYVLESYSVERVYSVTDLCTGIEAEKETKDRVLAKLNLINNI